MSTKQTKTQISLGDLLKTQRKKLKYSYSDVYLATRIRKTSIKMMEENDFSFSSTPVIIKNYLLSYAKFLGLDGNAIIELYEQSYKIESEAGVKTIKEKIKNNNFPKSILIIAALLLALLFFRIYLLGQIN